MSNHQAKVMPFASSVNYLPNSEWLELFFHFPIGEGSWKSKS